MKFIPLADKDPMSECARDILRTNHIMTMRELSRCSEQEVLHFQKVDYFPFHDLDRLLAQLGAAFRPEEDDPLLYGYPETIRSIAREKGRVWEHRLLLSSFITYYDWLRPVRNLPVEMGQSLIVVTDLKDKVAILNWCAAQLKMVQRYGEKFGELLGDRLEEAVGPAGVSGDVRKIMQLVDALMDLYKDILYWRQTWQYVRVCEKYRFFAVLFCQIMSRSLLEAYDDLYKKMSRAEEELDDCASGRISPADVNIKINIQIDLDYDTFHDVMETFMAE